MNSELQQQILNMKLMVNNFKASCHYAALKNDGTVDKQEQKLLKRIDAAADQFLRELQRIQSRP